MRDPDLTIDITKLGGSDLQKQLAGNAQTLFTLGQEAKTYHGKPVKTAADQLATTFAISAPGSWKTSTGIGFTLKASASCKIAVGAKSSCFKLAKAIDSTDTQDIYGDTPTDAVYVNVEMDFDIQGNLSGSGNVAGIGIAGKASGKGAATFAYCHPVAAETETGAAIVAAFQALKFPFQPDSVTAMPVGAIANVKFDGTFGLELDLSYGLGKYTVGAPGLGAAKASLKIGAENFTAPSLTVDAGARAAFSYQHGEHYEALVSRTSATGGTLMLSRSASDETDESLSIHAGISLSGAPSASIDTAKLANAINEVTGGSGGAQAAGAVGPLQASAVSKASSWLTSKSGDKGSVGLSATLAQQRTRAVLYEFSADLGSPALAEHSWSAFAKGDLETAMRIGGLTLLPGSGVSDCLKRSNTIDLQFLNLFAAKDTETYFKNTSVSVAADGSLRYSFDVGEEAKEQIKKALQQTRFHFVASGIDDGGDVEQAEVDLRIEMTEPGRVRVSNLIVDGLATVASVQQETAMRQFLHDTPKGTLAVEFQYAPTAYGKIQSARDEINWQAFQAAVVKLLGLNFVSGLSYDDWALFNRFSLDGADPLTGQPRRPAPDRRQPGDPSAVPPSFYSDRSLTAETEAAKYFLLSSAQFMNLCADLAALGNTTLSASDTTPTWNELVENVWKLVLSDVNTDWSVPAASALLALCGAAVKTASLRQQKDTMTCAVRLS